MKPSATVYRVWYANFLTAMGRFQEAIDFGIKTIELDPLSGTAYVEVGWTYFHARQDEQSLKFYEQGLALESYYPIGLLSMGWLMSELGNSEEAIRITNKAYQIISENPTLSVIAATNMARYGLKERAQDILLRFAQNKTFYVSPFCLAVFYIVMKDEHKAIEELRNAFSHHDIFLVWLKAFRSFDSIRQHNQFIDIYKKMNFPITQEIK